MIDDPLRHRPESCLSDLRLDRLRLGELPAAAERGVREHLATCAECTARLAALEAQALVELPQRPSAVGPAITPISAHPRFRFSRRLAVAASGFAAAAAALILILPRSPENDGLRAKGGDALGLVVRRPGATKAERVAPGEPLHPGDAVRFEVEVAHPGFAAVVGLDAAGHVTAYFPEGPSAAPAAGGRELLPGSVVLDGTLGAEKIFAVFCETPVPVADLVKAGQSALAARAGHPEEVATLAVGCREASVLIGKTP